MKTNATQLAGGPRRGAHLVLFLLTLLLPQFSRAQTACAEGPYNDPSLWNGYTSSGTPQVIGEVADEAAVCGTAISADLQVLEGSPYSAGLQINQATSPRFNANSEYRVRFRYRSEVERTIYYRMIPRALDNSAGGPALVEQDLRATTTYQQFDTVVASRGSQDSMLYQLWMNGDNLAPIYIDDFSMEQVGGPCGGEDATFNDLNAFTSYGGVTLSEVADAAAVCQDAFAIELDSIKAGPYNAGFEINQAFALDDVGGQTYRVAFRYRANAPRTAPLILTSRQRGTFGGSDGPQYAFANLAFTTEYQTYSNTFVSTIDENQTDRLLQILLAVGADTTTIYLDSIAIEQIVPERTLPTTLYVHPDGSDDNPGDALTPAGAFRTLRYGLSQLIPGDSLLVADGIYAENNLRVLNVRGAQDATTVVKAINPWGAKIEGNIRYNINLRIENSTHVKVEGFEIYSLGRSGDTNSATGLQIFGSDYVTLENNYVHDCGCGGISGRESDYLTIQRNVARDNARFSPYNCSGISIYQPRMLDQNEGVHILIKDNVSFENEVRLAFAPLGFSVPTDGNGIILDDFNNTQSLGGQENTTPPYVAQTVVENNLVFSNGGAGIKTFEVENVTIRNNTSYHNNFVLEGITANTGEIILQVLGGEAEVYNNLMVSESGYRSQAFSSQTVGNGEVILANNLLLGGVVFSGQEPEQTQNIFVTEDRQSFPQFAQAQDSTFFQTFEFTSVDDFKQFFGLRATSPAIDQGANDLAPAADLNGVARPIDGIVDIGAYEGPVAGVGPLPADRQLQGFSVSTPSPLRVDGLKDGLYTGASRQIIKLTVGEVADRADLSGNWTSAYTDEMLYVFVTVQDDSLSNNSDNAYEDDGVEFYFDGNNAGGTTYDADDRQFLVGYGDGNTIINYTTGEVTGAEAAVVDIAGGYTVEFAIPWALLGVTPTDSLTIGFDVQINDDDGGADDPDRDGKLAWAANQDLSYQNPSLFGLLTLVEVEAPPIIAGTDASITIDGEIDQAYDRADVYAMLNEVQPGISDAEDFSANWRALWDTSGLYFIVGVTDDTLINDSENWYDDDGVEIYIDARNEKATTYDNNDHQIVIRYGQDTIYDTKNQLGAGSRSAIRLTEGGYTVEAYIPWTALGINPTAGTFIGLDVHGIDDDAGEGGNDGKLAWFATIDESYKNPSLFGTALLGDIISTGLRPSLQLGDWLTVSPNPTGGTLRYNLGGFRTATLQVHDFHGRLLSNRTVSGTRGELELSALPNGVYLLTVRDGTEYARQRIVVQH
ncbi:sugar-binding protein [Neolewinella sp.]|uniref:sugar-binding protein n=1 Tax=Neolewinella sp. TaxID=2993543 RepID=UPI003B52A708